MHALVDLGEATAQAGLQRVDALPHRLLDRARQRFQPPVLLVQVQAQLVEPLVDVAQLVLQAVHATRDAVHVADHPVEPPVQLRERLGELVDEPFDGALEFQQRTVVRFELGQCLVESFGEDADLGAVRQLGQSFPHGAQRLQRGQPRVDLVQRVEDLLLFALADLSRTREHVPHAVERHVLGHG